jgi:hypothetical protein
MSESFAARELLIGLAPPDRRILVHVGPAPGTRPRRHLLRRRMRGPRGTGARPTASPAPAPPPHARSTWDRRPAHGLAGTAPPPHARPTCSTTWPTRTCKYPPMRISPAVIAAPDLPLEAEPRQPNEPLPLFLFSSSKLVSQDSSSCHCQSKFKIGVDCDRNIALLRHMPLGALCMPPVHIQGPLALGPPRGGGPLARPRANALGA